MSSSGSPARQLTEAHRKKLEGKGLKSQNTTLSEELRARMANGGAQELAGYLWELARGAKREIIVSQLSRK